MGVYLANNVTTFAVKVTAGTPSTAPVDTPTTIDQANVVGIELHIPAGHCGFTGIAFLVASGWVLPSDWGTYIIGDDDKLSWPLTAQLDSGAWSVRCYNTDIYDHTFYIRYLTLDFGLVPAAPAVEPAPPPPLLV